MPRDDLIQFRRGTLAQWVSANPILAEGEAGYITDTRESRIGDGVTPFVSLPPSPADAAATEALETIESGRLSEPQLSATLVPQVSGRMDVSAQANGTPSVMDTGQAVAVFGNTPLVVADGVLTCVPVLNTPTTNLAGYAQTKTRTGGRVAMIWARAVAPVGCNTSLGLVGPNPAWAHNSYPYAEIHAVFDTADGAYHAATYTTGVGEGPDYLQGATGSWADGRERLIAVMCDEEGAVSMLLPDGTVAFAPAGSIDVDNLSEYGIAEIYRYDNTTTSVPLEITAWGVADRDDLALLKANGISTIHDVAGLLASSAAPADGMQYAPASNSTFAATTSMADVDATNAVLAITAPPSGRMMIEVCAWVSLTNASTTAYLWNLALTTGSATGLSARVASGSGTAEKAVTMRWLLSGLAPGLVTTVKLRHQIFTATGGGIKVGVAGGYFLTMTALPLN